MVPRSAHRILLVEDEPLIRLGVADQLREAGYNVFEASSADQAMELLPRLYGDRGRAYLMRAHRPMLELKLGLYHRPAA